VPAGGTVPPGKQSAMRGRRDEAGEQGGHARPHNVPASRPASQPGTQTRSLAAGTVLRAHCQLPDPRCTCAVLRDTRPCDGTSLVAFQHTTTCSRAPGGSCSRFTRPPVVCSIWRTVPPPRPMMRAVSTRSRTRRYTDSRGTAAAAARCCRLASPLPSAAAPAGG
jgi:hypothetical protein